MRTAEQPSAKWHIIKPSAEVLHLHQHLYYKLDFIIPFLAFRDPNETK